MSQNLSDRAKRAARRFAGNMMMALAIVASSVVGILLVLSASTGVSAQVDQNREHFWRIIAGVENPNSTAVVDTLAVTLRDKLEADASGNNLPSDVTDFRTPAGRFGGISNQLGYNPFDNIGQACSECGRLSDDMLGKLLLVKQGDLDQVLAGEQASDNQGLYLAGGVVVFASAYLVAGTRYAHRSLTAAVSGTGLTVQELNLLDEPSSTRLPYQILAPAYYFGYLAPSTRRLQHQLYMGREKLNLNLHYAQLQSHRDYLRQHLPSSETKRQLEQVEAVLRRYDEAARNAGGVAGELTQKLIDEAEFILPSK